MKKIVCIIGAIVVGGCSGSIVGPNGSTSSGGGGVMGRGLVQSADGSNVAMLARNAQLGVVEDSVAFVKSQAVALGLVPAHDDFTAMGNFVGMDGQNHVRVQQMHGGIPVFGGDLVVHSNPAAFTGLGGNVLAGLQGLDLVPQLSAASAMSQAKADYAKAATNSDPLAFDREKTELVIFPIEGGNARLTWHVTFHADIQAGIKPVVMHYFIDAHDASLVQRFNGIHTAAATDQASGPGGISRLPKQWNAELDVVHSGSNYVMDTDRLQTKNLNHATSGGTIYSSTSLNFTDHEGNDAHGYAEVTLNMLKDWAG
jgi:Zn-dependent metalloprotease